MFKTDKRANEGPAIGARREAYVAAVEWEWRL